MPYRTQKILLTGNIDDETYSYLLWSCKQSNKLYNCSLFELRKKHFENCPQKEYFDKNDLYSSSFKIKKLKVNYPELWKKLKNNPHYQAIGGNQGQQTIINVVEGIKSYNRLLDLWFKKEIKNQPTIPNYRKSNNSLYQVTYVGRDIRFNEFELICYLPIPRENNKYLVNQVLAIPGAIGVTKDNLAELRIIPQNGRLWAEYIYKVEEKKATNLDYSQALGIDPGLNNLLTGVSTLGKSFIFCGKRLKFINQKYNQFIAKYKKGKSEFYWDDLLGKITHKRNCQIRDYINKVARFIVNYCLNHKIGNIVFGWNQNNKNEINIGKRNNQNFVQIPIARLKKRIEELVISIGINFVETEESYTSKSSFLDNDLLPKYNGEKPERHQFCGKRIKRGLYRTATNKLINADCNGAANILRKVSTQLNLDLVKVCAGCLTVPKRYGLTCLRKTYRKQAESSL